MSLWSPAVVTISVYSSSLQTLIVNVPRGSTGCSLLLWQYNLVVSVQCCVFHAQDCFVIGILCGKSRWIENFILKYKCTHSLGGFSTQSNKIQFISSLVILADYSKILFVLDSSAALRSYQPRDCIEMEACWFVQVNVSLPEFKDSSRMLWPVSKLHPSTKNSELLHWLKRKKLHLQLAWGIFISSSMIFSDVFLRLGILELLGSSHSDLGLVGFLCSNSCVKMNSIFLSGAQLLCWPVHLESCCQSGWFNSRGHLDFFQCCFYYFIPAYQVVSQHRQGPTQ